MPFDTNIHESAPMPQSFSAALPVARIVLRILMILNVLGGAAILALLAAMPIEQWIMTEFRLSPSPEADRLIMGLRAVAMVALAAIAVNHVILMRLFGIVETVRAGDPFVAANASRLQAIGWSLLGLQLLGVVTIVIAKTVSIPGRPLDFDAAAPISGWLAVLLAFVLARVFAEGSRMRRDLEGTI